jgi:hypothetical protein
LVTCFLRKWSKPVTGPRGAAPPVTATLFRNASNDVATTLPFGARLAPGPAFTALLFTKSSKPTPCEAPRTAREKQPRRVLRDVRAWFFCFVRMRARKRSASGAARVGSLRGCARAARALILLPGVSR